MYPLSNGIVVSVFHNFVPLLVFALIGLAFHRRRFESLLVFLFIYPLLPPSISAFDLHGIQPAEFLFLCYGFWWAILPKEKPASKAPPSSIVKVYLVFLCLSTFLSLLQTHIIFSPVFLLQLKENWNLLLPMSPSNPFSPLRALLTQAEGLLFVFIILNVVDSKPKAHIVLRATLYGAAAVAVLGILQYLFQYNLLAPWTEENPKLIRINSTLEDPNALGTYFAAAVCLGIFGPTSTFQNRRLGWIPIILLLIGIVLTGSRAAVVAIVGVILVALGSRRFRANVSTARWAGIAVLCTLPVAFLRIAASAPASSDILKGRLELWKVAFAFFSKEPVLGTGLGSFFYRLSARPYDYAFIRAPENVHNYFLQLLAETGLAGLFLFLSIIGILLRRGSRRIQSSPDPEEKQIVYSLLSAIAVFLISSITGHPLLLVRMQYLFWSLAAILILYCGSEIGQTQPKRSKLVLIGFAAAVLISFGWQVRSILQTRHLNAYEAGYYAWERDPDGRFFHWTKQTAISDLLLQGPVLSMSLRQVNPDVTKKPTVVEIRINHHKIDRIVLKDTAWKDVRYNLPSFAPGQRATLRLSTDATFTPRNYGSPDARALGVQVSPFVWECASSTTENAVSDTDLLSGVFRSDGQTSGFHVLPLRRSLPNRNQFLLTTGSGENVPYTPDVALPVIPPSNATFIYPFTPSAQGYRVSSTNALVIKTSFSGRGIFRILAEGSLKDSQLPVLYASANGEQLAKIPIFLQGTVYYFVRVKLPEGMNELSFSTPDNAQIMIKEIRAWENYTEAPAMRGWTLSESSQEVLFDSSRSKPLPLLMSGDSFAADKTWRPGAVTLSILASATFAGDDLPQMGVYMGRKKIANISINDPAPKEYSTEFDVGGNERLQLVFENDFFDPAHGKDRNIILNKVTVFYREAIVVASPYHDLIMPERPCFFWKRKQEK